MPGSPLATHAPPSARPLPPGPGTAADRLADIDVFARVVAEGGMSAAGRALGLSPAVISKRIRRLEERLGARLLQRTTRKVALTETGRGFHARALGVLAGLEEAEAFVTAGTGAVRGAVRVSAPTTFARLHVAPHLPAFLDRHPELVVTLELSDRFVDVVGDGYDLAIRIGDLPDASLVARRLAPSRRLLCASPAYLAAHGAPRTVAELAAHRLVSHTAEPWRLDGAEGPSVVKVEGRLRTNSSEVVREAVLAGEGVALRSTWDVGAELRAGRLQVVLPGVEASRRVAVHAVFPSRRQLAPSVRALVDWLAALYGPEPYWDAGVAA